jgi:hypothetical protein
VWIFAANSSSAQGAWWYVVDYGLPAARPQHWLGFLEEDDSWRWEPVPWNRAPNHYDVGKSNWPELVAAIAAYGRQVRGWRPDEELPPRPQVVFENGPFRPLVAGGYIGWKVRYLATEPALLFINLRWWRWADRVERRGTLESIECAPLLTQPEWWLPTLINRKGSLTPRAKRPRVRGEVDK